MIIGRFSVQCRPERTEEMAALIAAVEAPSRALPGVLSFDTTRSLTEPNTFVVLEVFEDDVERGAGRISRSGRRRSRS
jgi:quinol monooxygenase YgiN